MLTWHIDASWLTHTVSGRALPSWRSLPAVSHTITHISRNRNSPTKPCSPRIWKYTLWAACTMSGSGA